MYAAIETPVIEGELSQSFQEQVLDEKVLLINQRLKNLKRFEAETTADSLNTDATTPNMEMQYAMLNSGLLHPEILLASKFYRQYTGCSFELYLNLSGSTGSDTSSDCNVGKLTDQAQAIILTIRMEHDGLPNQAAYVSVLSGSDSNNSLVAGTDVVAWLGDSPKTYCLYIAPHTDACTSAGMETSGSLGGAITTPPNSPTLRVKMNAANHGDFRATVSNIQVVLYGDNYPSSLKTTVLSEIISRDNSCIGGAISGAQNYAWNAINTLTGAYDYSMSDLSVPTQAGPPLL